MSRLGLILLLTSGCGGVVASPSGAGASAGATSSTSGEGLGTTGATTSTTSLPAGSSGSTSTVGTGNDGDDPACSFLCPDLGPDYECSVWDQDCPPGEKCTYAYSEDGRFDFDIHRCVPLAPDTDDVGDPCLVGGDSESDTCNLGALCWYVDPETNIGTCVSLCTGSEDAPQCADPEYTCNISGSGVMAYCEFLCDPLNAAPCPTDGQKCYPRNPLDVFACRPNGSESEAAPFELCETVYECQPGTVCVEQVRVGACNADAASCCAPLCSLTSPDCPAGTTCVPFYGPGLTPAGAEDIGLCGQ